MRDDLGVLAAPPVDPTETYVRPSTRHETLAIAFLLFGGILIVAGWFIGVALLWTSHRWQLRDKLIGTFLLPGGLLFALVLYLKETLVFSSSGYGCTTQVSPLGLLIARRSLGTATPTAVRQRWLCL